MKGRLWLVAGAAVGIAVGLGHLPYLAGAARSLADDALHAVTDGGAHLVNVIGKEGAPRRVVLGLTAFIAALTPGLTALLLIVAARSARRLRWLVALLMIALAAAAFAYEPGGHATGAAVLAGIVAVAALTLTGPIVMAPLAALAGLIGTEYLPRLISSNSAATRATAAELHIAFSNTPTAPAWLRVLVLVVAAFPFVWAAALITRS